MSSSKLNFLVHLHEPARELLLCAFDAGTLSACCCVCKSWNVIVNSCEEAWKNACRKLGLVMEEYKFSQAIHWKGYALSIVERKMRMKKSTCFSTGPFSIESKDIKAVSNFDGRIAVAFSDRIQIWRYETKKWELDYRISFEAVRLMIQNNVLLAGTTDGIIRSWRILSALEITDYSGMHSSLTSFDCIVDLNIVAGSYTNSNIAIWNFLTGEIVKTIYHKDFMLVKIMLSRMTPEEASQRAHVYLFSVDVESICLRILKFDPSNFTQGTLEVRRISIIPHDPTLSMPRTFTFIGSLLFDGQFLYYLKSSPRVHSNTIGVWDVHNDELFKEIRMLDEVKGLIAVGKKYMVLHTKDRNGGGEKFCITKRLFDTEVGFSKLPRDIERLGTFDNQFVVIGETSWLDGLNGLNDQGLLYACLVDNEGLKTQVWNQRIVKVF